VRILTKSGTVSQPSHWPETDGYAHSNNNILAMFRGPESPVGSRRCLVDYKLWAVRGYADQSTLVKQGQAKVSNPFNTLLIPVLSPDTGPTFPYWSDQ
jgi:hypothetical protein